MSQAGSQAGEGGGSRASTDSMSDESGSDFSEETPPGRNRKASVSSRGSVKNRSGQTDKSSLNTTAGKSISLNLSRKSLMTPEEKKQHKEAVSDRYFKLMEKYGPKRRFLQAQEAGVDGADGEAPPMEPIGFVIKFRLSHAYKALEKQEIEASVPSIKPVKKRKRTKFLLPDERRSEIDTLIIGPNDESTTGRPSSAATSARSRASRRVQIRLRGDNKENAGSPRGGAGCAGGQGAGGTWSALTEKKAPAAIKEKEKQQREENAAKSGTIKNKFHTKAQQGKWKNPDKQTNKQQQAQKSKSGTQSKIVKSKPKTEEERRLAVEQSVARLRADSRHRQVGGRQLWDLGGSHGPPGSVGAATTEYSFGGGDSVFRMFSDSAFDSRSITMDAMTIASISRPSSPSKSFYDGGSRPSSARRRGSTASPKVQPRTSTPAGGRPASPLRPKSARSHTPNQTFNSEKRRAQSATSGGNNTTTKGKSITAILRMEKKEGNNKGGPPGGKDGPDNKILAPRKISKYLYDMCNCHQVARKETIAKLYKKRENIPGVIEIFGCPESEDPRGKKLACPFCNIIPGRRIHAWLDNLEDE